MKTRHRKFVYNTQTKTYRNLLKINIHTRNIQILMTEIFKCLNKISPSFAWDYYVQKSNHRSLGREHSLKLNKCKTKTYGLSTAVFKGAVIWNNLPNLFKEAKSLTELKTLICEWAQFSCTCCICSFLSYFIHFFLILSYLFRPWDLRPWEVGIFQKYWTF